MFRILSHPFHPVSAVGQAAFLIQTLIRAKSLPPLFLSSGNLTGPRPYIERVRALQTGSSIFYGTVLLTGSSLLLRLVLMSFQVFFIRPDRSCGNGPFAADILRERAGLYAGFCRNPHLCGLSYRRVVGPGPPQDARAVLRGCFRYALVLGTLSAAALWHFAPALAQHWIGSPAVIAALRICALFLPLRCLGSVLDAYCTSVGRIRELILWNSWSRGALWPSRFFLLFRDSGMDSGRACAAVALGNGAACTAGFCALLLLQHTGRPCTPSCSAPRPPLSPDFPDRAASGTCG